MMNEEKSYTTEDLLLFIDKLRRENKQLKERITYLENSNNRREETIISLRNEQQLDKYKEVIEEVREYINKHSLYYDYDENELYPIMGAGGTRYRVTGAIEILDIVNKVLEVKDE